MELEGTNFLLAEHLLLVYLGDKILCTQMCDEMFKEKEVIT